MMRLPASMIVLGLLVGACSPSSTTTDGSGSPERLAAIRQAREAVEEPAVALGSAALTVDERVRRLTTISEEGLQAALESAADANGELGAAADAAKAVQFERSTSDTAAAAAAIEAAAAAGEQTAADTDALLEALRRGAEIDEQLGALAADLGKHGSRRELMDHFATLAAAADDLADGVEADTTDMACSAILDLRVDAARTVAAAARELRELAAGYRGTELQERQTQLETDPYGVGTTLWLSSQQNGFCPLTDVVAADVSDVTAALDRMQQALSPGDL